MQFAIGALALAFIALAFLTLLMLYWLNDQAAKTTVNWPVVGKQISDAFIWFRDRNAELLGQVVNAAIALVHWSEDRIWDAWNAFNNLINAIWFSRIIALGNQLTMLNTYVVGWVTQQINGLHGYIDDVNAFVHGFVLANIDALNFWKAATQHALDVVIIPQINALIATVNGLLRTTIPTIQARLGVAEKTITQTLPAEIAETKTDIGAVQRVIGQTLTAPQTGLLDRTKVIEGDLARVLPWATAIGISIPVAANLARLGRNPCWCSTDGPLQDNGDLELATLMDLI